MELVVGDVDQPGAEETSPANYQQENDVVRAQIVVIAVDILDLHSFSDMQSSMDGQTENIMMLFRYEYLTVELYYPRNMMKKIKK